MAQSTDNTLSNQSGASFRTELNSILGAHLSSHKGGSEPSYITTGAFWIDDTSTPWIYKVYDGAASFGFLEINPSTNNVTLINVKDGDARTEGASIGQIQDSAFHVLGSVSGTNTITASLSPAITAYAAGQSFNFVVAVTNTGAVTINVNSLGAKAIQKNGAALVAGDLTAGDLAHIIYDGTQFQLVSPARTPVLASGSIATAALAASAVTAAKIDSGAATDGQVLTADGAGGVAFEDVAAAGGVVSNGGYVTNRYYFGGLSTVSGSGVSVTADRLYLYPFYVGADETFTRIGLNVVTGAAGNARMGVYNSVDGQPASLLFDAGTVSTASTGNQEVTISQLIAGGLYWIAVVFDATPGIAHRSAQSDALANNIFGGTASTAANFDHIYRSFTYGTLPDPVGGTIVYSNNSIADVPAVWLRKV